MIQAQQLLKKINALPFQSVTGVWYRGIRTEHLASPLQYSHSTTSPSRFIDASASRPTYPILYFTEIHDVALKEVSAVLSPVASGISIPNPAHSWTIINVSIALASVLDLTDEKVQKVLQTNFQELTGDWWGYRLRTGIGSSIKSSSQSAPTQKLGAALYDIPGLVGFMTVSAKDPIKRNLIVFPNKIKSSQDGQIEYIDPATKKRHCIPLI